MTVEPQVSHRRKHTFHYTTNRWSRGKRRGSSSPLSFVDGARTSRLFVRTMVIVLGRTNHLLVIWWYGTIPPLTTSTIERIAVVCT